MTNQMDIQKNFHSLRTYFIVAGLFGVWNFLLRQPNILSNLFDLLVLVSLFISLSFLYIALKLNTNLLTTKLKLVNIFLILALGYTLYFLVVFLFNIKVYFIDLATFMLFHAFINIFYVGFIVYIMVYTNNIAKKIQSNKSPPAKIDI